MAQLETRFSGNVPENYDRGLGPYIFDYYARQMADRCAALDPKSVLETAAGTGIVTRYLRESLSSGCALTATDLNQPMLDYAAVKLSGIGAIEFGTADACDLPFEDNMFDAMVCQFGVMFFPDRQAGYREALRVLKPGGTYLFSVWDSWKANPFAEIVHDVGAEFVRDDPPGFYKVPFSYSDVEAIEADLRSAGFKEWNVEFLPHQRVLDDIDLFAHGIVHGNPLFNELKERGVDPEAVGKRIAQSLDERLGESMPLQAIFITARNPSA
ncbi:class I SAM-dependent methyltransferase [Altererythrobacter sp.]|uniref:class I SAM-dependent methyltransferase n=1 Tax=Altererythrobacter sp. TaxID=1872480 RepID=UPI003D04EABF